MLNKEDYYVALKGVAAEGWPLVAAEEAARDDREVAVEADHETTLAEVVEARDLE